MYIVYVGIFMEDYMEEKFVHVLVSRSWFNDMFMTKSKIDVQDAMEIAEAIAAFNGMVIKFSSSISFDDGFWFAYPKIGNDAWREDAAISFSNVVDMCNKVFSHIMDYDSFDEEIDIFLMNSVSVHSKLFQRLDLNAINRIHSNLKRITTVNPDVANRFYANCAAFSEAIKRIKDGRLMTQDSFAKEKYDYNRVMSKQESDKYMFHDASKRINDMFQKYNNAKKSSLSDVMKSSDLKSYTNGLNGWRSEIDNDGSSGFLNIQRATDNINRKETEE